MKIEIWSDVVCPFCYIGKRIFEKAIASLDFANDLEIEWKSFQLDPTTKNEKAQSYAAHLAEKKNISLEEAQGMLDYVTNRALEEGLHFDFSKAIAANTHSAHLLIQYAKNEGKGPEMEEILFQAFFVDGENIGDQQTLIALGQKAGLNSEGLRPLFNNDELAYAVKMDLDEARQIGVTSVPFFVLDRKYAIAGAQPLEVFTQSISKAYHEWKATAPSKN